MHGMTINVPLETKTAEAPISGEKSSSVTTIYLARHLPPPLGLPGVLAVLESTALLSSGRILLSVSEASGLVGA